MTLDVEALLHHLHSEVQFYNDKGGRCNHLVLDEIRAALESFDEKTAYTHARRFDLVKIALDIGLTQTFRTGDTKSAEEIAIWSVTIADAVLAEMAKKKEPEAENDDAK